MDEEGIERTQNNLIHIGHPIEFDEEQFFESLKQLKKMTEEEVECIKLLISKMIPTYVAEGVEQDIVTCEETLECVKRLYAPTKQDN